MKNQSNSLHKKENVCAYLQTHTHITKDDEKALLKSQYVFATKTFIKLWMEGNSLNIINSINEKPTSNITVSVKYSMHPY